MGKNVLDGPLSALRHLIGLLSKDEWNEALEGGELITTGTLTRAWPVQAGEVWRTSVKGLEEVQGCDIRFE